MADLVLVRSYDIICPLFVFGTKPEPSDTKRLLLTLTASTDHVTTKMVNNYNKTHSKKYKNKNEIGLMASVDEFYFHWEMYGHTNVDLPKVQNNKETMPTKEMLKYPIIRSLMYKLYNPQFKLEYISYQQYLYKTLMKNTVKCS